MRGRTGLDAVLPPQEAREGRGSGPTTPCRYADLRPALPKPYDCSTSTTWGWPQIVPPDTEFPKELNGDNPFLIGDLRVLGNFRLRLLPR
jgi:hypothetical protein